VTRNASCGFCFSGSGASLLAKADGKAKPPDAIGLGHLGNANAGGSAAAAKRRANPGSLCHSIPGGASL